MCFPLSRRLIYLIYLYRTVQGKKVFVRGTLYTNREGGLMSIQVLLTFVKALNTRYKHWVIREAPHWDDLGGREVI